MTEELPASDFYISLEHLEQREAQLQDAQYLAELGIWEWDVPTNRVTWSDELYDIYGVKRQDFAATYAAVRELIHPDDRSSCDDAVRKALAGHEPYIFEHRIIRSDGSTRILRARGAVVTDGSGQVTRMFGTSQDITEYKQLAADLQSSRRRYRMLFDHNLAGVFLLTLEGKIVDCNEAYAKMVGYDSRAELFNLPSAELHLDIENRTGYLERLRKEGEITGLEYRLRAKDGREVWVVASAHVVEGYDGTPLVQGTATDITAQKLAKEARLEAERKYRDIFENAGEGIFQTTPEGEYIAANPALARMHGFDSAAALILSRNDISGQVYVDPLKREEFKRRLEERGTVHGFEHEIRRADGNKIWISVNARVVRDEQGQVLYYEGTAQDITERKQTEEQVRFQARVLAQVDDSVIAIDNESRITYWNEGAERLYGFEAHEVIGKALAKINHYNWFKPEDEKDAFACLARCGSWRGENIQVSKTGKKIFAESSVSLLKDDQGRQYGMLAVIRDATARKLAEESLRESENFRRMIIESEPECVKIVAPDCILLDMNPAGLSMVEADCREEVIGRSVLSIIAPEWRDTFKQLNADVCQGETAVAEFEMIGLKGTRRWMETHAVPLRNNSAEVIAQLAITRDITEHKRSEEALRKAEQKYHDIFENAGEGIFQTTANGRFITANRALAQMLGFLSPEDLMLNVTNLDEEHFVDPQRRVQFKRMLEENDSVRNFEYQVYRKDGSTIWISDNARTVRDESGTLLYYEGTARDITDRKEAAGELIKQKEILQKIFDYTPMMITFIGADGRTRLVNREWERTLGWSFEEVTWGNLDVFAELYPDPTYREEVLKYIAAGSTEWADFKTRVRDGRIIDTTWANVLLSDGTSIGIGKDITARKQAEEALQQSEERYRDLVENSEELICTHDMEGRILSANRAAAIALGHQPKDYTVEKNLRDILAPEVGSDEFEDYLSRLQEEGFAKGLMLIQTSTGERRIWEYYNTLRMEGVATPIVRGMAHDITDRKRSEKEREVISEVIESVSLTANLDELLKLVHQSLKKVVYAENCFVALYDKETGLFSQRFYIDQERSVCPPPLELKKSLAAYVLRTGLPYLQTVEKNATLIAQGAVELIEPAAKAWLGVPLNTPVATIGVLVVQHYERADAYNNRDLEFLSSVGAELALAIERKRTEAALRESEERYRGLFENAKDAIYVHDLNGTYTSVNRAAEKLSGYSRTQIIGKNFSAFIAPEHLHQVRENMWKKLSDHGETSYEMDFIARNGSRVPVEVSSRLIYENGSAVGVQGMARDITERKRAREASQAFSRRLIEAQEGERQRIARELHDQIGQILTAVQFNLQFVQRLCKEPKCHPHIEDSLRVLDEALDQVRDLSFELRPSMLDDLGLVPALRWYVSRQARLTGLRIEFLTELPAHSLRFGLELETACFRIAQEAVTNVARHAHPKRVSVQIQKVAQDLLLIIKDDGVGFDVDAMRQRASGATLGIQGMQERALAVGGTIEIDSAVANGTTIRASFPIKLN